MKNLMVLIKNNLRIMILKKPKRGRKICRQ